MTDREPLYGFEVRQEDRPDFYVRMEISDVWEAQAYFALPTPSGQAHFLTRMCAVGEPEGRTKDELLEAGWRGPTFLIQPDGTLDGPLKSPTVARAAEFMRRIWVQHIQRENPLTLVGVAAEAARLRAVKAEEKLEEAYADPATEPEQRKTLFDRAKWHNREAHRYQNGFDVLAASL